ncbi:MAG: GDP-mannose-dependent alpha-(1-6)-phosphatidylinositol monomannoside mannosyltransferase [Luteibacter sp.]|uniref:glycosyltransferase family 4 protein n=1 Tax=Luteibacter sp. TaxID=1886636 RepID=UPI0013812378|nr:MAG: GDP-mannose-dependent alpha-(1-6)-phosphatidylinositol monomannoside mannosyltransferase [Luteibacter sp.]
MTEGAGHPANSSIRRRVLLISRNFPPLKGGMERLNCRMASAIAKVAELNMVGPRGAGAALQGLGSIREVPLRPLWRFFLGAFGAAGWSAITVRPELTVAGSGLCAPFAWMAARLSRGRYAVYVHGLDVIARHWAYRAFWLPFIRRADICVANSHNTARLCREVGVPGERTVIVHPGVELADSVAADDVAAFRRRERWEGRPVLLSVGRLTARKGMLEFVDKVFPRVIARHPRVLLVVMGNDAPDALTGKGVRDALQALVEERGLGEHIRMLGEVDDATLALGYAAADVAVFPVRTIPGDVEGFGMVAVEAAAHGLPTVAYATGGVPDAVKDGVSGYLVPADDTVAFAGAIDRVLQQGKSSMSASSRTFAAGFDWSSFDGALQKALGF